MAKHLPYEIELVRFSNPGTHMVGTLVWQSNPVALTEELPYNRMVPDKSCLPNGRYTFVRARTSRSHGMQDHPLYGDVFTLYQHPGDIPIPYDRVFLLPERQQWDTDIAIVDSFPLCGSAGLMRSDHTAFKALMACLESVDSFTLRITRCVMIDPASEGTMG